MMSSARIRFMCAILHEPERAHVDFAWWLGRWRAGDPDSDELARGLPQNLYSRSRHWRP
jgi:hypothetical protein